MFLPEPLPLNGSCENCSAAANSGYCLPLPMPVWRCASSRACCRPPVPCPLVQTADLSAKNLGNEGFAYVVDALSFNDRCAPPARPPPQTLDHGGRLLVACRAPPRCQMSAAAASPCMIPHSQPGEGGGGALRTQHCRASCCVHMPLPCLLTPPPTSRNPPHPTTPPPHTHKEKK